MAWFMGIDIGSSASKAVIIKNGKPVACHLLSSGINYGETARKLVEELLTKAGLSLGDIAFTVATGYGAERIPFDNEVVGDIRCCARGINSVFSSARTVIDIQGTSSQVLRISDKGQVTNFAVSEKCAAGSGIFLEIIANVLRMDIKDIGPLSLKSKNPVSFTTGCAVFGESEAISRVSEGAPAEDILAGVHQALASKIYTLVQRVGLENDCAVSGGGALDIGLLKSIEERLDLKLLIPPHPRFITALGAAIIAGERAGRPEQVRQP